VGGLVAGSGVALLGLVAAVLIAAAFRQPASPGTLPDRAAPSDPKSPPDLTIFQHPLSPSARLAVQERARVVIVFDRSPNMIGAKDLKAQAALKAVLTQLPPGSTVSGWVFGQAQDAGGEWAQRLPDALVRGQGSAEEVNDFVNRFAAVHPDKTVRAGSAVVRTMFKAADADLKGGDERKTLLVLAGGEDNRFHSPKDGVFDPDFNPQKNKTVADALREKFAASDVRVAVALFQPDGDGGKNAEKEFGVVATPTWDTPGVVRKIEKGEEDQRTLQSFLEQELLTRCRLEGDGKPVPLTDKGPGEGDTLAVTRDNASLIPSIPLKVGTYTARVGLVAPLGLELAPGDFTVLAVRGGGAGVASMFDLETARRGGRPLPNSGVKNPDWRLTLVQNEVQPTGALTVMVSADPVAGPRHPPGILRRPKPGFVWFDLEAADNDGPLAWSFGNPGDAEGYPAPVWRLTVPEWPKKAKGGQTDRPLPVVRAWVASTVPAQDPTLFAVQERDPSVDLGEDFRDPVKVGGDELTGVRVTFEPREVQVRPGESLWEPCLVVRARFPKGRPVFVQVEELPGMWVYRSELLGAQHEYRTDAASYTAMFWPVPKEVVVGQKFRLRWVSVKAAQDKVPVAELRPTKADWNIQSPRRVDLPKRGRL
jgi:hypothetical protein